MTANITPGDRIRVQRTGGGAAPRDFTATVLEDRGEFGYRIRTDSDWKEWTMAPTAAFERAGSTQAITRLPR